MITPSANRITFEQFERMPDEPGKQELLEGEVIEMPPTDLEHATSYQLIYHSLREGLAATHANGGAPDLGKVRIRVGYRLPGESYVRPDVSITHRDQPHGKYLMNAPAIAIEVVTETETASEMEKKLALYFRYGAREVWRVYRDPLHFVIHLANSARVIWEGSLTTPLLPGFELPLAALEALLSE